MEDFDESVALTDFTLDDFRAELTRYIEANRKALEDAPLGLFAVVPTQPEYAVIQPGVVFCLRQEAAQAKTAAKSDAVNPLQPYYLVYVLDDGSVRFTFTNPKQILEILRATCAGQTKPYEALCRAFEQATDGGNDMQAVDKLLQAALRSLQRTFTKRVASSLTSSRTAVLPTRAEPVTADTEFELITWFVIR